MGLPTDSVLLRNPPETEYWTRFLTKRRDPGFSHPNPNDYLSLDAESSAENEYWTRFMTKRGYRARSRLQFRLFKPNKTKDWALVQKAALVKN